MLAVVAFPALAEEQGRKIAALRDELDPNATRIAPHFTLVFPNSAITEGTLVKRMQDAAADTAPFAIALKRVLVHREGDESYLYLVPEAGYDAVVALHARLNGAEAGKAAFTPHVTVGRLNDRKQARSIATALVTEHFVVNGQVEALSLVKVPKRARIRTLHSAPLRG